MHQIAIYGKGGIGKSTTSSNISASLGKAGIKVLQIGCDPKQDSTKLLLHNKRIPTILDKIRDSRPNLPKWEEIIHEGVFNVLCAEAGGPAPGVGCAGQGIKLALNILNDIGIYNENESHIQLILYDVLGDVVCGGFAVPMKVNKAEDIYIVTSEEFMPIYAANNIAKGIRRIAKANRKARLAGIIVNERAEGSEGIAETFCDEIGTKIIARIPFDENIRLNEMDGKTIVEGNPISETTIIYNKLAHDILDNPHKVIPNPMSNEKLEKLFKESYLKGRGNK